MRVKWKAGEWNGAAVKALDVAVLAALILLWHGGFFPVSADPGVEGFPARSLEALESSLTRPEEVLIATADLQAGLARLAQQRGEMGLKLFGGASGGYVHDAAAETVNRDYATYDLRAGLRWPLLGRNAAEKRGEIEAESGVEERLERLRLARIQCLAALRRQYLTYWSAQEKLSLSREFLSDESEQTRMLDRRRQAGYLLEADYLEFLTAFDLARRNQANLHATREKALGTIRRLTHDATGPFLALPPRLPNPPLDPSKLAAAVRDHYPSVRALRQRLDGLERIASLTRVAGVDANMDFYTGVGNDDGLSDPEYSVGVSFGAQLPLGRLGGGDAPLYLASQAQIEKARQEWELERKTVTADAEEALSLYRASQIDLAFANQRVQAAMERIRESALRAAHWEGDTLEKLIQSRYAYYLTALDDVDSRARNWSLQVNLLAYAPEPVRTPSEDGPGRQAVVQPEKKPATADTLYVWQSRTLREQSQTDPEFWRRLAQDGVHRLLISLDRGQLDALAEPLARVAFMEWMKGARSAGIDLELLLGEPLWIRPEHRGDLLEIVKGLSDLPFVGLHLDMEPDQLEPAPEQMAGLLKEWLNTLSVVKAVSPWPIGVSLHPRFLQGQWDSWPDLGRGMARIGIAEVALMVYVRNPRRVVEIATGILERYPELTFSVAQSVEPQLSDQESHWKSGWREFETSMETLAAGLDEPNFRGLFVQDWTFWRALHP